ncbi:hypothetical protein [Halorubellus litoreus]|uniref:Halobacterial output domain-containing protein n=1 Tax=Halorubellus litoreus TaxID=755308 RepID=A0ABD5VBB3_9EURY
MTDAAIPVTQSAVERFTDRYLRSLGCEIERQDERWAVNVPNGLDSELLSGGVTLICSDDADDGDLEPLHPESSFFQQLISEASEQTPTGRIAIGANDVEIQAPEWLQESDVEIRSVDFAPYYDRTAIVVLFQVGIETVSEYQTELLRTVAVDAQSEEILPTLEETFLEITSLDNETASSKQAKVETTEVRPLLDIAREQLIDRIGETVDDVHQNASRAADAEVEEYRQMQQQRIEELEEKDSRLASRIEELSGRTNSDEEDERLEALKKRKELKAERQEVDAELTDLRRRRDQGFPERQREIRERHALEIRLEPLTLTEVEYERGEIEFELTSEDSTHVVTLGYGSGVGVTEEVSCHACGRTFDRQNILYCLNNGLQCETCGN